MSKEIVKIITEITDDYGYEKIGSQTLEFMNKRYSIGEGEPEDMTFNRDLQHLDTIGEMLLKANELGKKGISIEIVNEEEKY